MSPRLNSPPTEKVGAQENRHTTRRAHPRGTDGSNPAPSSGESNEALARWYRARTADSRLGTRKTMIVALARKLMMALWRFVTTGETLEGAVLRPAG